jgi:hypothetical protein
MPAAARRGKREAETAAEERSVREGRDRGGEVAVAVEEERRWRAASSERNAEREPEAEAGESISSTSMSSASMEGGLRRQRRCRNSKSVVE